jgi:NTP pyrophosphatase (non-canonical NTP hydrolase)
MTTRIGTANTVGELKKILEDLEVTDDFPVRVSTLSHTWPVDVTKHQLCITLEPWWHARGSEWTDGDWAAAFGGEVGEVVQALLDALAMTAVAGRAQDLVKKLRRHQSGLSESYNTPSDVNALRERVAEEVADVLLYGILLCWHVDVDLIPALIKKFNMVSEAQGFPERIGVGR